MTSRKKVLIIDDEPAAVAYLTALLEDEGYATCSATEAAEGLALARTVNPDLICVDIMMPKRSGVALYRDIRHSADLRDVPVLFVSGYTQVHTTLTPQDPAFFKMLVPDDDIPEPNGFIEKPIVVEKFVRAIVSLIGPGAPWPSANIDGDA